VNSEDYYKPRIIDDFELCGIAANTAKGGDTVKIIEKMFISSLDEHFEQFATNLLSHVTGGNPGASLNSIYVLIKPDKKAYVYTTYPFGNKVFLKNAVKQHRVVFESNVADITSVFFKDDVIVKKEQNSMFCMLSSHIAGLAKASEGDAEVANLCTNTVKKRLSFRGVSGSLVNDYNFNIEGCFLF